MAVLLPPPPPARTMAFPSFHGVRFTQVLPKARSFQGWPWITHVSKSKKAITVPLLSSVTPFSPPIAFSGKITLFQLSRDLKMPCVPPWQLTHRGGLLHAFHSRLPVARSKVFGVGEDWVPMAAVSWDLGQGLPPASWSRELLEILSGHETTCFLS